MARPPLLDGIDVFVEVVNARSFSRAAARLGLPATTVSARIKRLEARLGTALLHRTTRQLSLTDAGERYFAHCAAAMDAVMAAEHAVANTLEEPRGRLRITAPADLAQTILVPAIKTYLARHRDVTIDLIVSNQYRDLVAEGIDLAVRVGALASSSLIVRRFFTSAMALWAAPEYLESRPAIRSLPDLAGHPVIRMQTARRGLNLREGADSLEIDDLPSQLKVDDMLTCQAFAESGMGIALLPLFINRRDDTSGRLVRVLPQVQTDAFAVQFLYPPRNVLPPTVRSFIETALESAAGQSG